MLYRISQTHEGYSKWNYRTHGFVYSSMFNTIDTGRVTIVKELFNYWTIYFWKENNLIKYLYTYYCEYFRLYQANNSSSRIIIMNYELTVSYIFIL